MLENVMSEFVSKGESFSAMVWRCLREYVYLIRGKEYPSQHSGTHACGQGSVQNYPQTRTLLLQIADRIQPDFSHFVLDLGENLG
jgi:hypothetical protein